jgi:hypothetical protein
MAIVAFTTRVGNLFAPEPNHAMELTRLRCGVNAIRCGLTTQRLLAAPQPRIFIIFFCNCHDDFLILRFPMFQGASATAVTPVKTASPSTSHATRRRAKTVADARSSTTSTSSVIALQVRKRK